MRSWTLAILLILPLLSGCISAGDDEDAPRLTQDGIIVPDGAALEPVQDGFLLSWTDVEVPARLTFILPEGATIVRAMVDGAGDRNSLWLVNDETGRRRCNTETTMAWNRPITDARACSALAVVDRPGTVWRVEVNVPAGSRTDVRVLLEDTPLDGLAAKIRTDRISHLDYEVGATESLTITSFDGTALWTELTLPAGVGPWPTIVAATPYNAPGIRTESAMWDYFVHDFVKRGFAVVVTDVRGYGNSGGCVEVWGANEQRDQVATVEWVAQQPWSDGNVGFYGQSYVATTPVEAAVYAPEALKAIIAVAPVVSAYDDWHYGGVPNGESILSPLVGYQAANVASGANVAPEQPIESAERTVANLCEPLLTAYANDPRFIYQDFYAERDFKLRAGDITAAVLFTQGFHDSNVKSAMIPGWFNEIEAPKLGLFGNWVHQHPPRADGELLMLAWLDQYVKGRDLGLEALPPVDVRIDRELHRTAGAWPEDDLPVATLYPALGAETLGPEPVPDDTCLTVAPVDPSGTPLLGSALMGGCSFLQEFTMPIDEAVTLSGVATLRLEGAFETAGNAHVAAALYRVGPEGKDLVTFGMANLAHRGDHTQYLPFTPGESLSVALDLLPTEAVFWPGDTLVLEVRSTDLGSDLTGVSQPARIVLEGGHDGTRLLLPGPAVQAYEPLPATSKP